jgi:hypothetical protein
VCTENLVRVDDVMESPKLADDRAVPISLWPSWPRHSSRSYGERDAAFSICQYNVGAGDDCQEVYA